MIKHRIIIEYTKKENITLAMIHLVYLGVVCWIMVSVCGKP